MDLSPVPPAESGNISNEVVIGNDQLFRVPEEDMYKQLHRNIGALTFKSRKVAQLGKGSGTLISPNLVLTAAHNLYSWQTG